VKPERNSAVSETFDGYYKWLGITPDEQPPNHYRLLGIRNFEADADVIAGAADKQMAHVRSFQAGKHSALSQKILNEIAAARICLLTAAKKAAYDEELSARLVQTETGPAWAAQIAEATASTIPPQNRKRRPSKLTWQLPAAIGAGLVACVAILIYLSATTRRDGSQVTDNARAPGSGEAAMAESPASSATGKPPIVSNKSELPKARQEPPSQAIHGVVNQTDTKEADEVIASVRTSFPAALESNAPIELLKYHNAADFRHNAGGARYLPNSYSDTPFAGRHKNILFWGVWDELPAGNYLIVYRLQSLDEATGDNFCNLDICRDGRNIAQFRPKGSDFTPGQWTDMPVMLKLTAPTKIQYRLWPNNHRIALDRVYLFRCKE
jgi:hypothetical protein